MSWNKTHSKGLEEKVKRLKEANSELREHIKLLQQPKSCDGCKYNRTDEDFHSYVCDDCCRKSVDRYEAKGVMR